MQYKGRRERVVRVRESGAVDGVRRTQEHDKGAYGKKGV